MNNLTQPAYPIVPLQDNFKRLIVPIPGLSKLEHFALELYKIYKQNKQENDIALINADMATDKENPYIDINILLMNTAIYDAITFLNLLDEKIKTLNNEKSNEMAIFDR
ncbi:MAG: hypothetical protein EBU61_00100 [Crocinitomicaceae bacterium]|nr:hypothetical protein [Crocinitomicaceae bacterium]